jgi:hypothetical protein
MGHRHFIHNLRTVLFITAALIVLAAGYGLWWANRTGLPDTWRATIEEELVKQGAYLTIDSLSYIPFKGLVAKGVRVFSDKERSEEVSRLERIVLDFNKADLAKKSFRLTRIELSDAHLSIPLDPKNPDTSRLEVTDLNGTILMPGGRLLEARDVRGRVAGIDIVFGARMLGYRQEASDKKKDQNEAKRREIAARCLRELEKWKFDEKRPPVLRIFAEGDLSDKSTLSARINLHTAGMEKNGHVLDEITASGTMIGNLLTLTSLKAVDSRGAFDGRIDYDINTGEGRFDLVSALDIPGLLKAWAELPPIPQVTFGGSQRIEAAGDFKLGPEGRTDVKVTGSAKCESVMLKGISFDSIESAFAWRDGNIYLRDILLQRKDGVASGKALVRGPIVQMALKSTLPSEIYLPLVAGQPLETVIQDFGKLPDARVEIELEGGFDSNDHNSWAYTGRGQVDNITFKGVPVAMAKCSFSLSHHELDFHDGTVTFNYDNYGLRNAFNGPSRGTTKVGRVRYDPIPKHVEVEGVEGSVWAAPLVRLFAPKIADTLEVYRFHHPPALKGSGIVDVTPQGRTDLTITFSTDKAADYQFLGENLTLSRPSGQVVIRGNKVNINDLKLGAFGGPVASEFEFANNRMKGEISWSRIDLEDLAAAYGFELNGGKATGRIEFTCTDGKIETMDGKGLLGLERAELFSVPMFGPLSKLVAGALGERGAGYQRAKDAFMNFEIRKGVLSSSDFRTTTSSLVFTGEGNIDLPTRNIDITVRMNARGFLGLITLPLRPFYGLFQFHGSGPMKDTEWKSELFTQPTSDQNKHLLSAPRAKAVEPGPPRARVIQEN